MLRCSPLLGAVPGLAHGFTTARPVRPGGPALDLGPGASDEDWRALRARLGMEAVALASQVHGATALRAEGPGLQGEGDALVSDRPGLLLAVRVADCVPILVAAQPPGGRAVAVAAIHAGWRGLVAGVIGEALAALRALAPPGAELRAAIGPCIGRDAYEVGPEVVEGLASRGHGAGVLFPGRRPGRWQVDLRAAAAQQLVAADLRLVDRGQGCTWDDPELFSHRRQGARAGRLAGLIGVQRG